MLRSPSYYAAKRLRDMRARMLPSATGKRFVTGASGSVSSRGYVNSRGMSIGIGMQGVTREALYSSTGENRLV